MCRFPVCVCKTTKKPQCRCVFGKRAVIMHSSAFFLSLLKRPPRECPVTLPFCIFAVLFFTQTLVCPPVRDRVRTKMERDILADVNHPFVVKLHYGESASRPSLGPLISRLLLLRMPENAC